MVFTPGSTFLICLTAFSVSMPAVRYSSCPVEIRKVSASKIKSVGSRPYFFVAGSKIRFAIAVFFSAVSAMPSFVDSQGNHSSAVTLGHGQYF